MKKILILATSLVITMGGFVGCGNDDMKESKSDSFNDSFSEVIITSTNEKNMTTTEPEITTTTDAVEEPTTEEAPTESKPLSILPGSKERGKNIVPGLKLGMKKDEVFNSMEISYDKEESVRNDEGAYDYYYNLDSIELFDINECAQFYVRFDSSEKLALYGYHVGRDGNSECVLSQEQLSSFYDKAYSYLVDCFGAPSEETTDTSYDIGYVRWLDTEIGDISIICGTNMWGIEGYKDLMICVEGEILEVDEKNNNSVDLSDDDLQRIENAFWMSPFTSVKNTPSSPSIKTALSEAFKTYDISVSSFSSDPSLGYYEYEVTVSGNYYKSVENKNKRITDSGSINFIICYNLNELKVCDVAVNDINGEVYSAITDILLDIIY